VREDKTNGDLITTVELETLKRMICRAIVRSKSGSDMDGRLLKVRGVKVINVRMNGLEEDRDFIDNLINMKYFTRAGSFACPKCSEELDMKEECFQHMLRTHSEFGENIEAKKYYWISGEFCTDYCQLGGHVIAFENGAVNRWRYRYFQRRRWSKTEKESDIYELQLGRWQEKKVLDTYSWRWRD
jgi:hypothetical protein